MYLFWWKIMLIFLLNMSKINFQKEIVQSVVINAHCVVYVFVKEDIIRGISWMDLFTNCNNIMELILHRYSLRYWATYGIVMIRSLGNFTSRWNILLITITFQQLFNPKRLSQKTIMNVKITCFLQHLLQNFYPVLKVPGPISQNGDFYSNDALTTQEILVSNFS